MRVARASGASKLIMTDVYVEGPNAPPFELPIPPLEWLAMPDDVLKQKITVVSAKLRALSVELWNKIGQNQVDKSPNQFDEQQRRLANERASENMAAIFGQYNIQFRDKLLPEIRLILAAIIARRGVVIVPAASIHDGVEAYKRGRSLINGQSSIISGVAAGRFDDVAEYLFYASSVL